MDFRRGRGYLMDRFTDPPFGVQAITTFGPGFDPDLQYLASSYELAGRNFQPVVGPTGPNVLMALNGTAHGWYSNQPDPRPKAWYSIFDELTAHGRSWKIYYALPRWILRGTVWQQIIPPGHARDLTTGSRFFTDLARGHLSAFSFVRPGIGYSEEPREDIGQGDAWLGQLVSAVARSRYWGSTAIFITYDEGGGFWDHVGPPRARGYGTRVPLVIVSPWARRGSYWQRSTSMSVLSFMQHLWNLPPLTPLNAPWQLCGYTPRQLRGAYGVTSSGMTGRGQTIAIVDAYRAPAMLADSRTYAALTGDPRCGPASTGSTRPARSRSPGRASATRRAGTPRRPSMSRRRTAWPRTPPCATSPPAAAPSPTWPTPSPPSSTAASPPS